MERYLGILYNRKGKNEEIKEKEQQQKKILYFSNKNI
jgi:hypothetical protein